MVLELRYYFDTILKWRKLLIATVVAAVLCMAVILKTLDPVYQSTGKLWIKTNSLQQLFISNVPSEVGKFEATDKDNAMGTVEEIIDSNPVIGKVIMDLNIRDSNGDYLMLDEFVNPSILGIMMQKKGVEIENLTNSDQFKVTAYSDKPEEARTIAEEVLKNFMQIFSLVYRKAVDNSIGLLNLRLNEIARELDRARSEFKEFKVKNGVYNYSFQVETLTNDLLDLESDIVSRTAMLELHKKLKVILNRELSKVDKFQESQSTMESNSLIESFRSQLADNLLELEVNLLDNLPSHPHVKALQTQIDKLKEFIANEEKKAFSSEIYARNSYYDSLNIKIKDYEIDIASYPAFLESNQSQISVKREKLNSLMEKEREFNRISTKINNLENIYDSYVLSLETAASAKMMKISSAVVLQWPALSENVEKNRFFPPDNGLVFIILAVILGTMAGVSLSFTAEYIDECIWNYKDIEKITGNMLLEKIPMVKKDALDINMIPMSSVTGNIFNILVSSTMWNNGNHAKTITLLSAKVGEGKTTVALFLATSFAESGKKTLLIDGNLRNPSLHKIFNLSPTKGLGEYILEGSGLGESVSTTTTNNLHVMCAGNVHVNHPQSAFNSKRFKEMLNIVSSEYDIVLIDTAAYEKGKDAMVLARLSEGSLLVIEHGKTKKGLIQDMASAFSADKIHINGTVLNKCKRYV